MKPSAKFSFNNRLVKISQAAEILGVSIDTLRRWEASGKITPIRTPGGTRLYSLEELQNLNPKIISPQAEAVPLGSAFDLMKISSFTEPSPNKPESPEESTIQHINVPHKFSFALLFALLLPVLATGLIVLSYLNLPQQTSRFFSIGTSHPSDLSFGGFLSDVLHSASSKIFSPLNPVAQETAGKIDPQIAQTLKNTASNHSGNLPQSDPELAFLDTFPSGNVLAASAVGHYLEINTETVIRGGLAVEKEINGLTLAPGANGASISDAANSHSLTFSGNINLNQPLSTTSSPTFSGLTLSSALNVPTLNLSSTSKQIVFGTNGTLTWTPSSSKTLTMPDVTGTLITKDSTDTLSNKTINSSDSNTISGSFTGITGLGTISAGTWNGTKIGTGYGGTGLTSYTTGDVLYASASDTLSKLTIGSSGQLLTVSSGIPAWSTVAGVGGATGTGASGQVTFWNGTSTVTGSNSLWWDSTNGNLGIGTTNPGNRLTISGGNVGIGTTAFVNAALSVMGGNVGIGTTTAGTTGKLVLVGSGTTSGFNFRVQDSNFADKFLIMDNGNVGIGTTVPGEKLEIAGNLKPSTTATYTSGTQSLSTTANTTYTGSATNRELGTDVTSGDVNGDGYSDLIVGAPTAGGGTGNVYIYYGSATGPSSTASVTLAPGSNGDDFGYSVATADVNGDGYQDIIVGSSTINTNDGRAYIFYGSKTGPSTTPSVTINGGSASAERFGISVADAGDVNGDGYQDVIIGAYKSKIGGTQNGKAYIFYGGSSLASSLTSANADVTLNGETGGNSFGANVNTVGDVNGDGYADTIVGAYSYSASIGRVYIFYGGPNLSSSINGSSANVIITGATAGDSLGMSTGPAGDVNGDGYPDIIIGAYKAAGGGTARGQAYIFYGGPNITSSMTATSANVTISGQADNDNLGGRHITTVGDINGDGYADVIIGADQNGTSSGKAYIFYGSSSLSSTINASSADITFTGESTGDSFGYTTAGAGDVNGDGYQDIIIGALGYANGASTNAGRAYYYQSSGNRWKSMFAQNFSASRGLQIDSVSLDRWGLYSGKNIFGITTPDWSITRQGTANFQNLISTGNVGIGTPNPGNLLTISGGNVGIGTTASINGALAVMGGNVGIGTTTAGTTGKLVLVGSGTTSGFNFRVQDSNFADKFLIMDNGNVGIGTTNPGNLLTINGNVGIGTTAFVNAGLSVMTGNVGIGSTSPQRTIDIVGQALINDNLISKQDNGIYFGRTRLSENQWGLNNVGNAWTAKDSSRAWTWVAMSSDGKYQTAVTWPGNIYISSDYGNTWIAKDSSRNWSGVAMSSDGKYQTAVVSSGQIYISSDYGATWVAKDSSRVWTTVAMSSDGKYQTAVVDNGQIYISSDYGATWVAKDSTRRWYAVAMSSDGKYQTATLGNGGGGQVYISSDYGNTWAAVGASGSRYAVAMSSDGKYQTAPIYTGQMYISSDYGVTWTAKDSSRYWNALAMSADGRYQSSGVYTGQMYISSDYGVTWTAKDSSRNWYSQAISSDGKYQTAVVNPGYIYVSYANSTIFGNLGIGTTNPGNLLTISGGNVGIGTTASINGALAVMGGNVGIGTTDPTTSGYNLSVVGTGNFSGNLSAGTINGNTITTGTGTLTMAAGKTVSFADAFTTTGAFPLTLTTTASTTATLPSGTVTLAGLDSTQTFSNKTFSGNTFFPSGIWDTNGNIGIGTTTPSAGTRLAIMGGNVGIGTTAPTASLDVAGSTAVISNTTGDLTLTPAGNMIVSAGNVGIGTTNPGGKLIVMGGNVGIGTTDPTTGGYTIDVVGTAGLSTGTAWTSTSDLRFKNIQSDLTGSSLDKIMSLRPVSYTWNSLHDNMFGSSPGTKFGFIAQEVRQVIPEFITQDSQGYFWYNPSGIEAILTAGIQEQQKELNNLITQQSSTSNLLAGLSVDNDGTLSIPKLKTNKLIISADVNLDSSILNSSFIIHNSNEVDVLASLWSISDKLLGLSTQEATTSSTLVDLQNNVASTSATLSAAIASQSGNIASQSAVLADLQSQVASLSALSQTHLSSDSQAISSAHLENVAQLNLTPPDLLLATGSATLANLNITSDASISGKLAAYQATISDSFKALGETFLGNTTIAGDLSQDGTLSITEGSKVNAFPTLYFQTSPLAQLVDFFNGLIKIDNKGNLIARTVTANNVVTDKLTISTSTSLSTSNPVASSSANTSDGGTKLLLGGTSSASIGSGKIPVGQIKIPIFTTAVSQISKIFITPKSPTGGQSLFVEATESGNGFVVSIDHPTGNDIDFDWWIIETKQ